MGSHQTQLDNYDEVMQEIAMSQESERPDKYRQARVSKFFPQSSYGFVKDHAGHEIYFHLDELRFVGEKRDRSLLVEGASVGIDVSRTSRGLRVIRLKID